jgi:formate dehydrogenase iron-sulfur subunit
MTTVELTAGAGLTAGVELTAVDIFADLHDRGRTPTTGWYRRRIPNRMPDAHEQFSFAVDLDACTGCKACVVACHSMNGLDEDELWRSVGVLQSVSFGTATNTAPNAAIAIGSPEPQQRTVTTACHHCADPACLNGCPVNAYEKDVITGAVIHLDDQCIGCSYCTMTCPYDVPVFNERLGIVRKCDMCHSRLKAGESPACVQGCPNSAITIEIVNREIVDSNQHVRGTMGTNLVADAPSSAITAPSTTYYTRLDQRSLEQVDRLSAKPAESHSPLVAMLLLTQVAVGLSVADLLAANPVVRVLAFGFAGAGIATSTLHLGRPTKAWRVVLGIGHSWLSREAVALGGYLTLAGISVVWRSTFSASLTSALGLAAVFASVMVYAVTQRAMWSFFRTSMRFFSATAIAALVVASIETASLHPRSDRGTYFLIAALIIAMISGLANATRIRRYGSSAVLSLERSAKLLRGELNQIHRTTVATSIAAVVMLLCEVMFDVSPWLIGASGVALGCSVVCERILFFRSVSPERMPT